MRGETRAIIWFVAFTVFVMGMQFMFTALVHGVPMPSQTHGELVHDLPAELWASLYMGFGSLVMAGCYLNRMGLIAAGALMGLTLNLFFTMAAEAAEFGYLLQKGASRDATVWAGLLIWSIIIIKGKKNE